MSIPEELKYITPYVQRSQELAERDPIVSYYAQYYAVKLAIARGPNNKDTNAYLSHLLDSLEKLKAALGTDNEAIVDDIVGYAHVENFALKVFLNADNEDRSGNASKKTAKNFLAASIFLELLKSFGDLDPEVEAKIKYAKWKAADIMKALREGRTPVPGPPGGIIEENEEVGDLPAVATAPAAPTTAAVTDPDIVPFQTTPSISEFPSPPSNFTAPLPSPSDQSNTLGDLPPTPSSLPQFPVAPVNTAPPNNGSANYSAPVYHQQTPTPAPAPTSVPVSAPPPTVNYAPPPTTISPAAMTAAQKNAKWAISALNYEDIPAARTQLLSALEQIGFNRNNNFGF
ncbi:Vta1 like-domain-containing protein [Phycomyces blakesleeanus]|uniref:Vta1 like-domain-containing protein n=1 Tax=Phycomyces blakesleeanus TaxID=4837 RepID=A0ABR3B9Q6_PHYBL